MSTIKPEDAVIYCADRLASKAALAATYASRSISNLDKLKFLSRQELLLEAEATLRRMIVPVDWCAACGQWMGGPLVCCKNARDSVSEIEAISIRRNIEIRANDLSEPPFCAWCGGTCQCEDEDDDDKDGGSSQFGVGA